MSRPAPTPAAMEAAPAGPVLQLAALDRLAGSALAAAPAAMRRRSRPALANRRLTSSATDHRKVRLHLPLRKVVRGRCFRV